MKAITRRQTLCATVAACAVLAPFAQTAAQAAESADGDVAEVVVTGSRIRGIAPVGSNIVSLTRDEVVNSGGFTTTEILRNVPQIVGLGPSQTPSSAQNGAANVTRGGGINLRGVGVNATLLLFDGRRFPAAGTQGQFTDPSVIPAIALERLEVVPDGASAIYGSDAVAGVVNLILRKTFNGAEVRARIADGSGSYTSSQVSGIVGHSWGSGRLMIAAEHTYNSPLKAGDRDFFTQDQRARGGRDYRTNLCSPGNIVISGVTYPIPAAANGRPTASQLVPGTANLCDTSRGTYMIPKQQRNSVLFYGQQDLSEAISLFTEGYFYKRKFTLVGGGATAGLPTSLTVPQTNAFYVRPAGAPAGTSETVTYNFANEFGLERNPGFAQAYQGVIGADVKLPGDWKGQVSASYARSDDKVSRTHNINTAALNAALASSDPTRAFNPFGTGSANSSTVLTGLNNGQFVIQARSGLKMVNGQADGPLFALPGGQVRLAAGGEFREEHLVTNLYGGSTVAPTSAYTNATRHMWSVYGELFVPVVGPANAMPGVQELNLSAAVRYEKYSDFGSTTNPKLGVTWKPASDLTVRASYGTSFRAPGLAENSPQLSAQGLYGDTLPGPNGNLTGIGIAGANPNVQPETATTWSIGGEFRPSAIPGLRASLTYFSMDYKNQILGLRGAAGLLTNPIYAPFVVFNPTAAQVQALLNSGVPIATPINAATVQYIQDGRRQNLGGTFTRGIDFDVSYSWPTSLGVFNVGAQGSYFTKFTTALAAGAAEIDVLNTINYPQKFRARANLGWSSGGWNAVAYFTRVGSYTNTTVTPFETVKSYNTVDAHVGYRFEDDSRFAWLKGVTVSVDVDNLFDKNPPYVNISGGYDPQSASPMGRLVAFNISKTW
jgi:iron complex outermembrane receptor protein